MNQSYNFIANKEKERQVIVVFECMNVCRIASKKNIARKRKIYPYYITVLSPKCYKKLCVHACVAFFIRFYRTKKETSVERM